MSRVHRAFTLALAGAFFSLTRGNRLVNAVALVLLAAILYVIDLAGSSLFRSGRLWRWP